MRIRSELLAGVAVIALTTAARAGLVVELVPEPPPFLGQYYLPGQVVRTEVFLRQDVLGMDHYIRFLQFDFSDSHPRSALSLPLTSTANDIRFWDFFATGCDGDTCGSGYEIDDEIAPGSPPLVAIDWSLNVPSPPDTLRLPGNADLLLVAVIDVEIPPLFSDVELDLLNRDASDPNLGAEMQFGFGFDEPPTTWRAEFGQITGGRVDFRIAPEPATLAFMFCGLLLTRRRHHTHTNCFSPQQAA